jgi:hydroxymethylbilane synthase
MVNDLLRTRYPSWQIDVQIVKTQGDQLPDVSLVNLGGKGLFTKELEQRLLAGEIDFAVHSLKDLPVELPSELMLAAYLKRELPNDVLISKNWQPLSALPLNGTVATGSLRRKFQLQRYRPDLQFVDVRGNIETRLAKLGQNNWDGLILAYAALARLNKTEVLAEVIPAEILYPAVGQGIIAVECRAEPEFAEIFAPLNDPSTATCALAERAFLRALGGGCRAPVGVISTLSNAQIRLAGIYLSEDGQTCIKDEILVDATQPQVAGEKLAEKILKMVEQK